MQDPDLKARRPEAHALEIEGKYRWKRMELLRTHEHDRISRRFAILVDLSQLVTRGSL